MPERAKELGMDAAGTGVSLLGISNRGLLVIALLVGMLWGCIIAERWIVWKAWSETQSMIHEPAQKPVSVGLRFDS